MKPLVWITVSLGILSACNLYDRSGLPPVADYRITPESGKTTDTFRFDAGQSLPGNRSNKVYYRWDWNHDGIWDGEYSRLPVTSHRYYQKGTYNPVLEVMNSEGLKDTISFRFTVNQGYSAPHPSFSITPEISNLKTSFLFDASGSKDDEDSIGQLRFMWDFTGNGSWDTPLSPNPTTSIFYQDTGKFDVALQVVDPQNLRRTVTRKVWVTDVNTRLVADFSWTPEYGTTATTFILDGTASHNLDDPEALLRYSWKLPPEYVWSDWTYQPEITIQLTTEEIYFLELRVKDTAGLVNYCKKIIRVYHQNLPPDPKFIIGCRRGNIRTQFFFDSWPTLDPESLPTTLEVRWDFDGDGNWDTEYSKERRIYHNYPDPGTYKVYLDARDPEGLSDTSAQFIEVSPWINETGFIYDQRDGQYYGSVKIGDQWWMSQNLNFAPYDQNKDEVRRHCYSRDCTDHYPWCDILGGLYSAYHATREDYYGEVKGICPNGWHMPSRTEWETLIETIGGWDQADKLLPGGITDFNALYAGSSGPPVLCPPLNDFLPGFHWLDYATYFWSFNKMANPYAPNAWSIALIKGKTNIDPGWDGMDSYFSVRCVKNED
ncbi:MAG: PKD domain-containing protein [Bacteroidia bacterium]|nr:PKD domain-containing protein [Bacteroidia bacterium]